jgi:hypothetical protein
MIGGEKERRNNGEKCGKMLDFDDITHAEKPASFSGAGYFMAALVIVPVNMITSWHNAEALYKSIFYAETPKACQGRDLYRQCASSTAPWIQIIRYVKTA